MIIRIKYLGKLDKIIDQLKKEKNKFTINKQSMGYKNIINGSISI